MSAIRTIHALIQAAIAGLLLLAVYYPVALLMNLGEASMAPVINYPVMAAPFLLLSNVYYGWVTRSSSAPLSARITYYGSTVLFLLSGTVLFRGEDLSSWPLTTVLAGFALTYGSCGVIALVGVLVGRHLPRRTPTPDQDPGAPKV